MRDRLTGCALLSVTMLCSGCGEAVYVYSPPPRAEVPDARQARERLLERAEKERATNERPAPVPDAVERTAGPARPGDGASASPAAETVVARVNGESVTRAELVGELMVRHGKAVLEDLIRMKALDQEVARAGVKVREEEIGNELDHERAGFRAEPREFATFEQMVRERYGMSMEGYRGIVRRGLLIRKMILRRENPTEGEVMLWFYQNRERYDVPAELTVSHVFVAKDDPRAGQPRPEALIRGRLEKIRRALARDGDFAALARVYSDDEATRARGGELGAVNVRAAKLHFEPAFFEAMMMLKAGQTGGPVETRRGHHFIRVTARREGRRVEYEQVRPRVRVDYTEERARILGEMFLRGLMERAKIERVFEPPTRR